MAAGDACGLTAQTVSKVFLPLQIRFFWKDPDPGALLLALSFVAEEEQVPLLQAWPGPASQVKGESGRLLTHRMVSVQRFIKGHLVPFH